MLASRNDNVSVVAVPLPAACWIVCFRGQLQGRHRRFLTDLLGNDLIDRRGVLLQFSQVPGFRVCTPDAAGVLEIPDRSTHIS